MSEVLIVLDDGSVVLTTGEDAEARLDRPRHALPGGGKLHRSLRCTHCRAWPKDCAARVEYALSNLAVSVRTDPAQAAKVVNRNKCCADCEHVGF